MIYKAPFYAVTKAVYGSLSTMTNGLQWFDSSVPIPEIEASFKGQVEFVYGIFGSSIADCKPNKDAAIWQCTLNLEIYSNYKGRKVISKQLEQLLNYFSSTTGWTKVQEILATENYSLTSIQVGALAINPPLYSETGVWQSGSTSLTFDVVQKEA